MSIWNLPTQPQDGRKPSDDLKLYRGFLGLTQTQLAEKMCTTQTTIARWESGIEPITLKNMAHIHEIVRGRVQQATGQLFKELVPQLLHSKFVDMISNFSTHITRDNAGNLYLGSVLIGGCRTHSIHIRIEDSIWYALDRDGNATLVDQKFLQELVSFGSTSNIGVQDQIHTDSELSQVDTLTH
jgi:transcriptional regulator with XRE-family HTH domain